MLGVCLGCQIVPPNQGERMTFEEWEEAATAEMRLDRLWRMRAYRLACYLSDVGRGDAAILAQEPLTRESAGQLFQAIGSIRANLAEGYSRSAGKDRARIFEYGLGSARESREWYRHTKVALGSTCVSERCSVLEEIIRLLLAIIPRERSRKIDRDPRQLPKVRSPTATTRK